MAVTLGEELAPHVEELERVLHRHHPVRQQQLIEILAARHAMRMGEHAHYVADSMHKHVRQVIRDFIRFTSN